MRQRIRWFALHGIVRGLARYGARRGDAQARLLADPDAREFPGEFADGIRPKGPVIRCRATILTVDHGVAHDVLRSDAFSVGPFGVNLPWPLQWVVDRTESDMLHPLRPPSLLAVEPPEHTRYRKLVSSVFTSRAVATLRERVAQTAVGLLDGLEASGDSEVIDVVERYCSQLPVAVIGDILGVPDSDRSRILEFG